jgi:hypothetical protein
LWLVGFARAGEEFIREASYLGNLSGRSKLTKPGDSDNRSRALILTRILTVPHLFWPHTLCTATILYFDRATSCYQLCEYAIRREIIAPCFWLVQRGDLGAPILTVE